MKRIKSTSIGIHKSNKTSRILRIGGGIASGLLAPVWFGAVATGLCHIAAKDSVQSFAQKHMPRAIAGFVMSADRFGKRVGGFVEAAPYMWQGKTRAMIGVSSDSKEGIISYEVAVTKPEWNADQREVMWTEIGSAVCSYSAYIKQDVPVIMDAQANDVRGRTVLVVNNHRLLGFDDVGSNELLNKPVGTNWEDKTTHHVFLSEQQTRAFNQNMRGFCARTKEAVNHMATMGNMEMYQNLVVAPKTYEDMGNEIISAQSGELIALRGDAIPDPSVKQEKLTYAKRAKPVAAPEPSPSVIAKTEIIEGAKVILEDEPKAKKAPASSKEEVIQLKVTPKKEVAPQHRDEESKEKKAEEKKKESTPARKTDSSRPLFAKSGAVETVSHRPVASTKTVTPERNDADKDKKRRALVAAIRIGL